MWLATNTHYEMPKQLPTIVQMSHGEMCQMWDGTTECNIASMFGIVVGRPSIVVKEGFFPSGVRNESLLLHELTHYLQFLEENILQIETGVVASDGDGVLAAHIHGFAVCRMGCPKGPHYISDIYASATQLIDYSWNFGHQRALVGCRLPGFCLGSTISKNQ